MGKSENRPKKTQRKVTNSLNNSKTHENDRVLDDELYSDSGETRKNSLNTSESPEITVSDDKNNNLKEEIETFLPIMRVTVKKRLFKENLIVDEEIPLGRKRKRKKLPKTLVGKAWYTINPWRRRDNQGIFSYLITWTISTLLFIGLIVSAAALIAGLALVQSVEIPAEPNADPGVLLTRNGKVYTDLRSASGREDVSLTEIPKHIPQAVLAAEDSDFYNHPGINIFTIGRAAVRNFLSGSIAQGGSTITQQYVKVATGEDEQTIWRKIVEAATALKIERVYSKDKILELYLNNVYFGRGAIGIQAAAQAYFRKNASELTLPEAAMLAGLLPAPSAYDPLVNPRATQVRYAYVLDRMVTEGIISEDDRFSFEYNRPLTYPRPGSDNDPYPWFTDLVREELEQLGFDGGRGLSIRTTIDPAKQLLADQHYQDVFENVEATGALITLDNATGSIISAVGGKDYKSDQFNTLRARRQPGSTFKPFALLAWLSEGHDPTDTFEAPASITFPQANNGLDWTVNNFEGAEYGVVGLSKATSSSINTVYAKVALEAGFDQVANMANLLLDRPRADLLPSNASLVLGTSEVSPVELAGAYATIAADGYRRKPHTISEIRRGDKLLYYYEKPDQRIINRHAARLATSYMEKVVDGGSGKEANFSRAAAGKTGTTQGHGDAWFAGFTKEFTTVIWMGNRDNRNTLPGKETGGSTPAKLWRVYMRDITQGIPEERFLRPDMSVFGHGPLKVDN